MLEHDNFVQMNFKLDFVRKVSSKEMRTNEGENKHKFETVEFETE